MPSCTHNHGGPGHSHGGVEEQKMNFATRFNQLGEYAEGVDSVTYYLIDIIKVSIALGIWFSADFEEPDSDVFTYTSVSIALFLACIVAAGGAYCHGILNMQHQTTADQPKAQSIITLPTSRKRNGYGSFFDEQSVTEMSNSRNRALPHSIHRSSEDMPELIDIDGTDAVVTQHKHSDDCQHEHVASEPIAEKPLSKVQLFSIATDAISHGAGRAGAMLAGFYSIMDFIIKTNVPAPAQLALLFSATLFGVGTSWAEVITCSESLRRYNNPHSHGPSDAEDNLKMSLSVRFNQVGEYVESVVGVTFFIIGNINLITDLIERANGEADVFTNAYYIYSTAGAALLLASIISMGPTYCHGILNMLHQNSKKPAAVAAAELAGGKENNNKLVLSRSDRFWIETDAISHGSSRAGSLMSGVTKITQFITKGDVPLAVKLVGNVAAGCFGVGTSLAERNTCQQTLSLFNKTVAKTKDTVVAESVAASHQPP